MRTILFFTSTTLLLLLAIPAIYAQHADTIKPLPNKIPLVIEGNKAVNKELSIVLDSIDIKEGRLHIENGKLYLLQDDSLYKKNDSLIKRTLTQKDKMLFRKSDSLFRMREIAFRKAQKEFAKSDSLFRRTQKLKDTALFRKSDSLYRKHAAAFRESQAALRKSDSLFRRQSLAFKRSQQQFEKSGRLDSMRSINWKRDSLRIKSNLNYLKSNLQRIKTDSLKSRQSRQKKLVVHEFDCNDNAQLVIDNINRKLIIKTTTENKVKLETATFVENAGEEKKVDWASTFNIDWEASRSRITIRKSGDRANPSKSNDPAGLNYYNVNFKSPLTIYVPASVKIRIDHRYNELVIMNDRVSLDLDLLNTQLKMEDAEKAVIRSRYGSVKAGSIRHAQLDLLNCNFVSDDLDKCEIDSKYSSINLKKAGEVTLRSFSDQYNIARVKEVTGNKSFGQFNITFLENSITLAASSADISIKTIDAGASTIKIENKYADVKLPAGKLQNYQVTFDGSHSKVLTAFNAGKDTVQSFPNYSAAFSRTVGSSQADATAFIVKCTSCSVDLR